jgi:protocatechuate 3,4-dioxygenase beta subunit
MENDDRQVGRILTRREVIALLGAAGAAMLTGCLPGQSNSAQPTSTSGQAQSTAPTAETPLSSEAATATTMPEQASPTADTASQAPNQPSCVVRPEQTEGPYFVDEKLNRSDIRSDPSDGSVKEGVPLQLAFLVSQVGSNCTPLAGAQVDVWHCDALGVYSDATDPSWNTVGKKFLRGYQLTDANGSAQFTTIYPGWYQGRTVHIHFKIRTTSTSGQSYEFTSQLFFDETITDQVHAEQPYATKGERTLRNDGDNIYQNGGSQLLLSPTKSGQSYSATFDIGLDLSDTSTGQSDHFQQSGGSAPPGGPRQPGGASTPTP